MRALVLVAALGTFADARPAPGRRLAIDTPVEAFLPQFRAAISRVIYLERCEGGCRVNGGSVNDAKTLTSTIPSPGNYNITEFENAGGQSGAQADAEWAQIVTCMKEVYSPFDVEVTDVKPSSGSYHLAIIAGNPQEIRLEANVLGVAPLASNCAAFDNVISFSFSSAHRQSETAAHVQNVCWTAAQESAHAFGLDHEFEFVDGRSACSDPMTYRMDCGGQKFFRNVAARCGEEELRDCRCSNVQSSHRNLVALFGAGTSLTGAPTVTMTPATGGGPLPANVIATAFAKRGVAKLELFLNGFPMTTVPGAPFGANGQLEASYGLVPPATMPDSIYDVFVRATDDLGTFTDTPTITVTKNAPCTSADACLAEQKCEAGKCSWDPPVGELGDTCGFDQFCKGLLCRGTADLQICTQTCSVEDPLSCPQDMSCNNGVCFFTEGGCCSAAPGDWMPAGLLAFLVMIVVLGPFSRAKPFRAPP
ncbi:MAG: Ig-like domain-containing protein [Deltaproteobacteria bacterium]|nr:Ig-like domain-containing protein [Deltaproteobacteria bacterium]